MPDILGFPDSRDDAKNGVNEENHLVNFGAEVAQKFSIVTNRGSQGHHREKQLDQAGQISKVG